MNSIDDDIKGRHPYYTNRKEEPEEYDQYDLLFKDDDAEFQKQAQDEYAV